MNNREPNIRNQLIENCQALLSLTKTLEINDEDCLVLVEEVNDLIATIEFLNNQLMKGV